MRVLKYYVENKMNNKNENENKVKENKVLYCKALRCENNQNQQKNVFPYVKHTNLLSF